MSEGEELLIYLKDKIGWHCEQWEEIARNANKARICYCIFNQEKLEPIKKVRTRIVYGGKVPQQIQSPKCVILVKHQWSSRREQGLDICTREVRTAIHTLGIITKRLESSLQLFAGETKGFTSKKNRLK